MHLKLAKPRVEGYSRIHRKRYSAKNGRFQYVICVHSLGRMGEIT